ncbi:hypothetical protein GQX74_009364 [Glossina fuscipes]|nr:hypothetical protein GQX74_009364 [Glossina fuscipes]
MWKSIGELNDLISGLKLTEKAILLRSSSDVGKFQLFCRAQFLLYTPVDEHIGTVPLEGMYMSKPVTAM